MNNRTRLFLLIVAVFLLVVVAPGLIKILVKNYTVSFIMRSFLVLLAIYLLLEIINHVKKIKDKQD
ncbi:MAG: hypothetical protein PHC81_03955 [Clostridia bacterium]|nr:hypothetical protein [Clostridia bacterium]